MDREKRVEVEAFTADAGVPDAARRAPCERAEAGISLLPLRRLLSAGRLLPGDWVEVRSEAEILATLDGDGMLDNLPFMSEMRRFIGGRFRVKGRADRTVIDNYGIRTMADTVHLDGLYCDGGAHDGCCRTCLLFWKEAWLRRAGDPRVEPPPAQRPPPARWKARRSDGKAYFCQATQLPVATLTTLYPRHLRWHLSALWNEGVGPLDLGRSLVIKAHDMWQRRIRRYAWWTVVPGTCSGKTPSVSLGLMPGDRVRVKPAPQILETLNAKGRNRGMEFSREMLRFCGQEFTVLRRCDRIIQDDPPIMVEMKDTVLLDGLTYRALANLAVPRGEYFFWRECWLERADGPG